MNDADFQLVVKALRFSAIRHKEQRRKGADASPYINHPIDLLHILANEAGVLDPVVLCAAILHDTVEDTATTHDEIKTCFGEEIARVVMETTDDKSLPKEKRKALQVEHAPHASPRAKRVKLADKIANLRDLSANPPSGWSEERIHAYFEWANKVVNGLRGTHAGLEKLFDETSRLPQG